MKTKFNLAFHLLAGLVLLLVTAAATSHAPMQMTDNPNPPGSVVKLIFVHHSTGENWLADGYGGLGRTLDRNNYFVSDTNYGWGPNAIGDGMFRIWGEERTQRVIPTRTWLDMGIPLALSSDAPSMPWWDPQSTLFASIVRATITEKPVSPEQALTMEEAMYAHTMGSAYADFAENQKGSLEPGKFADLIVWHDNPYTIADPMDILDLTIDLTMVGGKVVHQV